MSWAFLRERIRLLIWAATICGASGIGFISHQRMTGLKVLPVSAAGVYTVFLPIAAALIGVFVLGEHLNALQLGGFGLALLGVVSATLPTKSPSQRGISVFYLSKNNKSCK
jgi:drug/metabolite transporter (DMT)-like permease